MNWNSMIDTSGSTNKSDSGSLISIAKQLLERTVSEMRETRNIISAKGEEEGFKYVLDMTDKWMCTVEDALYATGKDHTKENVTEWFGKIPELMKRLNDKEKHSQFGL